MAQKEQPKNFEEALARLEEIVRALENGNAALDASLTLYEEGVSLVKLCNTQLDAAEQKVKILIAGEDGEPHEQDFTRPE